MRTYWKEATDPTMDRKKPGRRTAGKEVVRARRISPGLEVEGETVGKAATIRDGQGGPCSFLIY
jgi:hypothetical protein